MNYKLQRWKTEPTIELYYLTSAETWTRYEEEAWSIPAEQTALAMKGKYGGFIVPIEEPQSSHASAKQHFQEIKHHPHGRDWLTEWQKEHDA